MFGNGTQGRGALHIDDAVSAALIAVRRVGPTGTYKVGAQTNMASWSLVKLADGHVVQINLVPVQNMELLPPPAISIGDLMSRMTPVISTEETATAFELQLTPL